MKRIFALGLATASLATPLIAADCPMEHRSYSFEKTEDRILIIDDDLDSILAGVGDMAARYRGAAFIPAAYLLSAGYGAPVVSPDGVFINLGDLGPKDRLKSGEIPVFKGSYTCAK